MNAIKENDILRYPRLDTVLMVEEFIKKHDGEYKRKGLWENLPKKMMYQTFQVILAYLVESGKISIDAEGKIGWIYYPKDVKKLLKKKHLFWKQPGGDIMKKEINEIKQRAIPILKRHKVRGAALFGSASRGTMGKNSDVDILIDIKNDISLFDFVEIKLELEEALKRKVDLVEYDTIKPMLRKNILKDQVKIL